MKRCFGYTRVSTQKQGDGASLEAQQAAIELFAERNGIEIVQWFEERQTAAKSGRPVFGAMLGLLRRGKADGVVMHKIDRSARNFADWAKIGDLADAGIDVHFATETLDFRSRGGRLSADIQAVIAADYIRNLREEIRKGINGRLAQGLYPFPAPIGYRNNGSGKPKTLDPATAPLVRTMFELYATGQYSLNSLVPEMERLGLRSSGGRPLPKVTIEKTLNNLFYCGIIKIKNTGAFNGVHEPLISPTLFERVQHVKLNKAGKKVIVHGHAYRGLFQCACCNYAMTGERQKGMVYYRCHTPRCPTTSVREDVLEAAIRDALSQSQLTDEQIDFARRRVSEWLEQHDGREVEKSLKLQLTQANARFDALTDALMDRLIDAATFNRRKERLLIHKSRLEAQLQRLLNERADRGYVSQFFELLKSVARLYASTSPAEKRELLAIATSNRSVSGRKPMIALADWLAAAQITISAYSGAPDRDDLRTADELTKTLLHVMQSEDVLAAHEHLHAHARLRDTLPAYERLRRLERGEEKDKRQ